MRGSAVLMRRSRNSYIVAPRKRHLRADGLVLAQLEIGDALLGARLHRLLAGDGRHFLFGFFERGFTSGEEPTQALMTTFSKRGTW